MKPPSNVVNKWSASASRSIARWRSASAGRSRSTNARRHAELDAATELDEGDPVDLARAQDALRPRLPNLAVVGGCCGTDSRHVAAMWAAP
ncbi:MAG TPA: hypothetical protein VNO51_12690 [Ilumatobacteraceae bacterium]|nr:hypothetical protein [Ilumatobacteraceae bacterium]